MGHGRSRINGEKDSKENTATFSLLRFERRVGFAVKKPISSRYKSSLVPGRKVGKWGKERRFYGGFIVDATGTEWPLRFTADLSSILLKILACIATWC